jgi:Ca-activated chloride channel homolog
LSWLSVLRRQVTFLRTAVYGCTVVGALLVAVAAATPATPLRWAGLVFGVLIGAVAPTVAVPVGPPPPPDSDAERGPGWLRRYWIPMTAVLVVVVIVAAAGLTYSFAGTTACRPAYQLRLVADPATIGDARMLAAAYERSTARANGGCPEARIFAYPATSTTILSSLAPNNRWSDNFDALNTVGPRPDIWLADTRHQVDLVNDTDPAAEPFAFATPIARSPLVLAVPDGPADATPATWAELISRFTDPTPLLVRGTASSDDLDMLATIAMYRSEAIANGLKPAVIEQRIQAAVEAGRFPQGDATDLLCHRRQFAAPGSAAPPATVQAAIVATEQEVVRYNKGTLGRAGCGPAGPTPEGHRLRLLYPSDTLDQDLQFVELRWDAPEPDPAAADRRRTVHGFRDWLTSAAGRQAIVDLSLHEPEDEYPIEEAWGADPNASPPAGPVDPQRWQAANLERARAQQPSTLLFAVDSSESMTAPAANGSRQQVAAAAIRSGLEALGPQDEFALWTFSTAAESGHTEGVPMGLREPARLAAAGQFLDSIVSAGDTPLYRTLVDGADEVSRAGGPGSPRAFRAVVMLTDGEDTASQIGAADVVEVADARDVRIVLVTVGSIRCASPGLIALASTGNRCVDADPTDPSRQVAEVVAELKGGG